MMQIIGTIIESAEKASSLDRDALLLAAILALSGVVVFVFRDAKNTGERVAREHAEAIDRIISKMDQRSSDMDAERARRIDMLLTVIKDETIAKTQMTLAIANNTHAIDSLREIIRNECRAKKNNE